jgi:hypothetical protein
VQEILERKQEKIMLFYIDGFMIQSQIDADI